MQESSGPVSGSVQPALYLFPTFRIDSVHPKTSRITLYGTSPDPIKFWLVVSGFGQTDPVRKQANVQESSDPFLADAFQKIRPDAYRIRHVYWVFKQINKEDKIAIVYNVCSQTHETTNNDVDRNVFRTTEETHRFHGDVAKTAV